MSVIIFGTIFKRNKIKSAIKFADKLTSIEELKFIVLYEDHQRNLYQFVAVLNEIANESTSEIKVFRTLYNVAFYSIDKHKEQQSK